MNDPMSSIHQDIWSLIQHTGIRAGLIRINTVQEVNLEVQTIYFMSFCSVYFTRVFCSGLAWNFSQI